MDGLYIGAMGMLSSQQYINNHANNITNANTNGYKFDSVLSKVFEEKQAYKNEGGSRTYIGPYQNKVVNQGTHVNFSAGSYELTNRSLDLAIFDENPNETSFFVISKDGNEFLTRNGEFHVNEEGHVKTFSGSYLLDVMGERIIIPEKTEFFVDESGAIRSVEDNSLIAQTQIRSVGREQREFLEKHSEARFSYNDEGGGLPLSNGKIKSNMLEKSNVDISKEMVELMQAQRMFQASQKTMSSFDKVYEKEANELMK